MQAKQRLELAALFQFTYIGAPMVFYGDEAAINAPSLYQQLQRPRRRSLYSRAVSVDRSARRSHRLRSAGHQRESFYTKLAHLRKQYPVLSNGAFTTLLTGDTQQPGRPRILTRSRARWQAHQPSWRSITARQQQPVDSGSGHLQRWNPAAGRVERADGNVSGGVISLTLNALSGVVLLPYPASIDLTPPAGSMTLTPPANANGWNNSVPVTVISQPLIRAAAACSNFDIG